MTPRSRPPASSIAAAQPRGAGEPAGVPTRILVFHTPGRGVAGREFVSHWRTAYAELVRQLRPAIRFDRYSQLVIDPALSAVRGLLLATRSRAAIRTIAAVGRRPRPPSDGAQPRRELGGCLVVDQFHRAAGFTARTWADGAALAPLQEEWKTWCSRSTGLVGEDRTALAPDAPDPGRSQVVIMMVVRRAVGASRADMQRYWRHEHVPLASAKQDALRFIGYEQVEALAEPAAAAALGPWTGDHVAPHDGVAKVSYRSRLAVLAALFSPRAQRANLGLVLDELNFVDVPACEVLVGIERTFPP